MSHSHVYDLCIVVVFSVVGYEMSLGCVQDVYFCESLCA